MTIQELRDKNAICFEKITEGLEQYQNVKLVMDEKQAYRHFKSLRGEYGAENAFADFYYFKLDEDSREMVDELLTQDEVEYLKILKPLPGEEEEEVVFSLDDKLLRILVRLNAEEMLFSTIYFVQPDETARSRTTWWGNYDQEYICFKDRGRK